VAVVASGGDSAHLCNAVKWVSAKENRRLSVADLLLEQEEAVGAGPGGAKS
jgi:hypothetical protein